MSGKAKALRHKVQCLLCNEVFDNDYIKRHTRVQHKDYFTQNRIAPTRPFCETFTPRRIDCFLTNRVSAVASKTESEPEGLSPSDQPDEKYQRIEADAACSSDDVLFDGCANDVHDYEDDVEMSLGNRNSSMVY